MGDGLTFFLRKNSAKQTIDIAEEKMSSVVPFLVFTALAESCAMVKQYLEHCREEDGTIVAAPCYQEVS